MLDVFISYVGEDRLKAEVLPRFSSKQTGASGGTGASARGSPGKRRFSLGSTLRNAWWFSGPGNR